MTRLQPVPRALLIVSGLVLLAGLTMIFAGGWRTGISWDESYHVARMRTFLEHGWYLLPHELVDGEPGEWMGQVHVYSPATMGFLHVFAATLGVEGWGEVLATQQVFAVRHVGTGLIAALGLAAVAATARILLRSWAWAVVACGILVAIPMWTGHAMFNLKDIPTATGYSLVTLACVLLAREHSGDAPRWAAPLVLVAGLVVGVGTRPGLWPGLAAAIVAVGILTFLRELDGGWRGALRRNLWRGAELGAGLAVAQVLLVLLYPNTFGRPHVALIDSALDSAAYNDQSSPWWYVPIHLLIGMPTLLLVIGGIGSWVALRRVLAARLRPGVDATGWLLVGMQVYLMPLLAMLRESNLYNALRQLLFAAPAFAILVALGMSALLAWARDRQGRRRLLVVGFCAALVLPMLAQARLFPYNYAYATPLIDSFGAEPETDYWRTSVRELAPRIPAGGFVACSPMVDSRGRTITRSHDASDDCASNLIGPLLPYAHLRREAEPLPPTQFYAVVFGGKPLGENCTELARVERSRFFEDRMMSLVARCDLVLEPYTEPVWFRPNGVVQPHLFGGWSGHATQVGIEPVTGDSRLGFELPRRMRDRPLSIALRTVGAEELPLRVNGVVVPTRRTFAGFVADVPREAAAAYGRGRLVLSFRGDGDLRVVALSITAEGATR